MARVFHPRLNTFAKASVFGALFVIAGVVWIAYEVQRSLERWEPRINVEGIDVTIDSEESSTVYIDIQYVIRGTNDPRNLVFPFYVIPAEA